MSSIYFLRNDGSQVDFEVTVGTIGNAGTVAKKFRPGDSGVVIVGSSTPESNGNISRTPLGVSADLISSVLVIQTVILLGKNDDLDRAFDNLFMSVTLNGGLDGEQTFKITDADKSKFEPPKSIVVVKAIKFQGQ
jgi:hypothetical protein